MRRTEKIKRWLVSVCITTFVFLFSVGNTEKEPASGQEALLGVTEEIVEVVEEPKRVYAAFPIQVRVDMPEHLALRNQEDIFELECATSQTVYTELLSKNEVDILERYNLEAYAIAEQAVRQHVGCIAGEDTTVLGKSFGEYLDPMMFLALSICEMGTESDTGYCWTPAIYADPLSDTDFKFEESTISSVTEDTYFDEGLGVYVGCPTLCSKKHKHNSGINDATSIGPLQVLRESLPVGGMTLRNCEVQITDLMSWEQSIEYSIHALGSACAYDYCWNADYAFENEYELLALLAVAHNTGRSFLFTDNKSVVGNSSWRSSESIFKLAQVLSSEEVVDIITAEVDSWYEENKEAIENGNRFYFPGIDERNNIMHELNKRDIWAGTYVKKVTHKFYYPLKALVNYVALNKLYREVYGLNLYISQ